MCVSSPSFLSSPATVLQAAGLVPGQIPSAGRKRSVSSLSHFLEEFRANPGGSEKVFPPTDCRAHAWERRIGSWKPSSRANSQGRASEMARVGLVLGMTHTSTALGSPNNAEKQTWGHPSLLGGTGWGHVVPMVAPGWSFCGLSTLKGGSRERWGHNFNWVCSNSMRVDGIKLKRGEI